MESESFTPNLGISFGIIDVRSLKGKLAATAQMLTTVLWLEMSHLPFHTGRPSFSCPGGTQEADT
jgi:hypothetical protein